MAQNTLTPATTIETFVLTRDQVDPALRADIGHLMFELDPEFGDEPVAASQLTEIADSPYHAQFLVRDIERRKIVGAATMSILLEPGFAKLGGNIGYLGGVVAKKEYLRQPFTTLASESRPAEQTTVGGSIWDEVVRWSQQRGLIAIHFESEVWRDAAVKFYKKKSAIIPPGTIPFHFTVPKLEDAATV